MEKRLKIGLVGPESTGKSTLAIVLAERLQGSYVPEFAREYIGSLGRPYTYEDVCVVAERNREESLVERPLAKLAQSRKTANAQSLIWFFDTELIVTKVWLDEVYQKRPEWLTEPIPAECRMDFYLLLYPDLPAVPDPLRENLEQSARERLFQKYLHEIELTGKPYAIIRGLGTARLEAALQALIGLR